MLLQKNKVQISYMAISPVSKNTDFNELKVMSGIGI